MTRSTLHAGPVSARLVYATLRRWLVADRELHGSGLLVRIEWDGALDWHTEEGRENDPVAAALAEVEGPSKLLDDDDGFLELRLRLWRGRARGRDALGQGRHRRWSGRSNWSAWHRDATDRTYGLDHAARIAALLRAAGRAGVRMVVRPCR